MKRGEPLKRGKGLARGTKGLKRSGIKAVSKKRRAEAPTRRDVVAEVIARDGPWCWAAGKVDHVCVGPLDPDEYELRSARSGGHLDASNVHMLCRWVHSWKHDHPIEAAIAGLRPFPVGYMGDRTVTTSQEAPSCPRTGATHVNDTLGRDESIDSHNEPERPKEA